jgi:hypothetical protein
MHNRYDFLLMAVILFLIALPPLFNPAAARQRKRTFQNCAKMFLTKTYEVRYWEGGLADMPLRVFRALAILTLGMSGFFAYMFWTR